MPFWRRIGLSTSAWSTSSSTIGRASAATRPAKPPPTGMRTLCSTSSSSPTAARATSSFVSLSSMSTAAVSTSSTSLSRTSSSPISSSNPRLTSVASSTVCTCSSRVRPRRSASNSRPCSIASRHAVGDELEQLDVFLRECPRRQRTDVEHAEHVVREDERHTGHALDALLAQDRVQHVGVVDVVEHDRSPLGGDPAREPAADRDPHALLDLFLEPDRRPRDELVSERRPGEELRPCRRRARPGFA